VPNFIEIGQTSLDRGGVVIGPVDRKRCVMHTVRNFLNVLFIRAVSPTCRVPGTTVDRWNGMQTRWHSTQCSV